MQFHNNCNQSKQNRFHFLFFWFSLSLRTNEIKHKMTENALKIDVCWHNRFCTCEISIHFILEEEQMLQIYYHYFHFCCCYFWQCHRYALYTFFKYAQSKDVFLLELFRCVFRHLNNIKIHSSFLHFYLHCAQYTTHMLLFRTLYI